MKDIKDRKYSLVEGLQYLIYYSINLHIRKLTSFDRLSLQTQIDSNKLVVNNYIFNSIYGNINEIISDPTYTIENLGLLLGQGNSLNANEIYVKLDSTIPIGQACVLYDRFNKISYAITSYTASSTDCKLVMSNLDLKTIKLNSDQYSIRYTSGLTNYTTKILYQLNTYSLNINNFTNCEKTLLNMLLDEFSSISNETFTNTTGLSNYYNYNLIMPLLTIDTSDTSSNNILLNIFNIIEFYKFIKMFYYGLKNRLEYSLIDVSRSNIENEIEYDDSSRIPHFNFQLNTFNESYTDYKNFIIFKYKQATQLYEFYSKQVELMESISNIAINDGMVDVTNVEYLNNIEILNDNISNEEIMTRLLNYSTHKNWNMTELDHILTFNTFQLYDRLYIPFQNNNLYSTTSLFYKSGLYKDVVKWMFNTIVTPNLTSTELFNTNITFPSTMNTTHSSSNVLDLRNANIFHNPIQDRYYNIFETYLDTVNNRINCSLINNIHRDSTTIISNIPESSIDYNFINEFLKVIYEMRDRTIAEYETYLTTSSDIHYLLNYLFNKESNGLVSFITTYIQPTNYIGGEYRYQFIDIMKFYELFQSYIIKFNNEKYTNFILNFNNFKLDDVNNYEFIQLFTGLHQSDPSIELELLGLNSLIKFFNNNDSVYYMLNTSLLFLLNSSRLDFTTNLTSGEIDVIKAFNANLFRNDNTKSLVSVKQGVMDIVKQIVVQQ